jgi:hypothetical protein
MIDPTRPGSLDKYGGPGSVGAVRTLAAQLDLYRAALEAIATLDAPPTIARYVLDGASLDEAMARAATDLRATLATPARQMQRRQAAALNALGAAALTGNWVELAMAAVAYQEASKDDNAA